MESIRIPIIIVMGLKEIIHKSNFTESGKSTLLELPAGLLKVTNNTILEGSSEVQMTNLLQKFIILVESLHTSVANLTSTSSVTPQQTI